MLKVFKKVNGNPAPCAAEEIFSFLQEKGHVVSLVGAGGKTTLMYALAQMAAEKGFRTLVTTTTHIREPQNGYYVRSEAEMQRLWANRKPAVVGTRTADGKLKSLNENIFESYRKQADLVLIEADGSKQKPCKAPRKHEPVLLPECDTVLSVFGLKSIGQPMEDVCFGIEEGKCILGISELGHKVTPTDGVKLLSSSAGGRKNMGSRSYYAVVHQCDIPGGMEYGMKMLEKLQEMGIRAVLSCNV